MSRRTVLAALLVAAVGWLLAAESARWTLRHRPVRRLAPRVLEMLSERGAMEVDFAANRLVVRDDPAVLRRVDEWVARMDVPLRSFVLEVDLRRKAPAPRKERATDVFGLGERGWLPLGKPGRVRLREEGSWAWKTGGKDPYTVRGRAGDFDPEDRRLEMESLDVRRRGKFLWSGRLRLEEGRKTAFVLHSPSGDPDVLLALRAVMVPRKAEERPR